MQGKKYKGVNTTRKKLADGTVKVYRYYRKTGKQIEGAPGTKAFEESLAKAKTNAPPDAKDFNGLITLFKSSAEYTGRAAKTKADYDGYLDELRDEFGDMPLAAIEDKGVRAEFYAWRDKRAAHPRAADYAWSVLRRVLSIAEKRGKIAINHARNAGTLYASDRADKIPEPEEFAALVAAASVEFRRVIMAAVCTMLRQSDLCKLAWPHWRGDLIRFKTKKKNRTAIIPVHAITKGLLESLPRKGAVMLTTKDGSAWTAGYIKKQWAKTREKAGLGDSDLHFHDLRGLGITLAAEAGCTTPMIAGAAGLGMIQVEAILDRYGARTARLAAAMQRVIENEGSPFLQTVADNSANRDSE